MIKSSLSTLFSVPRYFQKKFCYLSFACAFFISPMFGLFADETLKEEFDKAAMQEAIQQTIAKVYPAAVGIADMQDEMIVGGFSGVIVSAEGHVLSAAHAIQPGAMYKVLLHDGREARARGLGREPNIDCALLKIEDEGEWPFAEMGWSFSLKPNQPCISISHPGELNIERGPVVRFGRIIDPDSRINGFVQSTCLMEPGDSGGPLFDMKGRVIGIHSMVQQPVDENYEVPIDAFRRFWIELNEEKTFRSRRVDRDNRFGFRLVRSKDASDTNFDETSSSIRGVRVFKIVKDSIADQAGLKKNDWISKIDSERVLTSFEIENKLFSVYYQRQENTVLTVERDGKRMKIDMPVPEFDDDQPMSPVASVLDPSVVAPISNLASLTDEFIQSEESTDDFSATIISQGVSSSSRAMATIVTTDKGSFLISKSSIVKENPVAVREGSTERCPLEIVARDEESDLVLMRPEQAFEKGLPMEQLIPDDDDLPGEFLLSPDPQGNGVVSVVGSNAFVSEQAESSGFFGVGPDLEDGRVVLMEVIPGGSARKAGFRRGDAIIQIGDHPVDTLDDLTEALSHYLPGDRIVIKGIRDEEEFEKNVTLGTRPEFDMHVADDFEGGKSKRRDGFESVFTHDALVEPEQCGGPVFDLDNRFRGINIARFSRTRCYAIPAKAVKEFLDESLSKIK